MKSVAGNLGAKELSRAAAEAEAALKAGRAIPALVDELASRFETVVRAIRAWTAPGEAAAGSAVAALEGDALREALRELRALIADNDAAALDACEDLEARVPPDVRRRLQPVRKALSGFDFEIALAAMDRVRQASA